MGILGNSSTLASDIEKATSEKNTQEKWGLIMDVCDKVTNGAVNSKECLKIVVKRLNHSDPHVVMQAITLLDACISNCGKQFHLEVASRDFESEFKKLLQKSQPKVNTRLKLCLKKWAETDFKNDPQLNLIPSLYQKLRSEGHDFSDPSVTPKREAPVSKDPNVVSSQQEEEDIAKAIELSLKESKNGAGTSSQSPKNTAGASGSLYPTALLATVPTTEPRKVRALYDFEAAEDNELTFHSGEIIMVLDDSDPNWWKGQNQRGEGLFPSNFVTSDLNAEPEPVATSSKSKKNVQFSDEPKKEEDKETASEQIVEINEEKIDRLLHLLHEADPEDPSADTQEMLQLEQLVNQMGPLIDTELERVDRKHAQLTQLSGDLVEAVNLYHTLMREPDRSMMMGVGPSSYGMPGFPPQAPIPGMYNMPGMYNQNMPGMFSGMGTMPASMTPYGMSQLRREMGQMSVSAIPQFPPPQQAIPTMSQQNGPASITAQQIATSVATTAIGPQSLGQQPPMPGIPPIHSQIPSQQAPSSLQQQAPQPPQQNTQPQRMPNMPIPPQLVGPPQQTPSSSAPNNAIMNLGHMQPQMQQAFSNPTSPPPIVSSAPSVLQQQQPPPHNQAGPRPPLQQQPAGAFASYAPPQQTQQAPPPNAANSQPPPTAPPNSINHPGQMNLQQFHNAALPPYMQLSHGVAPMGGGFSPISTAHHHHMLGVMPPGSPLSINTVGNSPQNIPIYQQQR